MMKPFPGGRLLLVPWLCVHAVVAVIGSAVARTRSHVSSWVHKGLKVEVN